MKTNTLISQNIILFDDDNWHELLPVTYTRPIAEIRVGILTIKEKWSAYLNGHFSYITQDYLSEKYPINIAEDNLLINATLLPTPEILSYINQINLNEAILWGEELLAARISNTELENVSTNDLFSTLHGIDISKQEIAAPLRLTKPYQIFEYLKTQIGADFKILTHNKSSKPLSSSNTVIGDFPIFLEEGATAECAIFNTTSGPVYLGKNSEVMEGCLIRGPFALGEQSIVKMGAKIYGPTSIGPNCRVGGEVNNAVLLANSNKGHDGFLGNSVIGEWCNLGADTNNSNLKNNYLPVKLWSYVTEKFEDTGLQFCGLIMGDHSKCGINTMFNTGTVVGVFANIYGEGFPRNFIPSFAWGGSSGFITHQTKKAIETAKIVMQRRGLEMEKQDQDILEYLFDHTAKYRVWEKMK